MVLYAAQLDDLDNLAAAIGQVFLVGDELDTCGNQLADLRQPQSQPAYFKPSLAKYPSLL